MNEKLLCLRCSGCGREYKPGDHYLCECGGVLESSYDLRDLRFHGRGMWRYGDLLPTKRETKLLIGSTPLYAPDLPGMSNVYLKDETRNPSLSLKDRASAVVVSLAKEFGYTEVSCASTGNAAISLACLCASEGLGSHIFVSKTPSEQKLALLRAFGAGIVIVNGSYDDAYDECNRISEKNGYYNRNTAHNPYTIDGKKTVSFEIFSEFGVPDLIYVPVGDGCIISGVWKGFVELKNGGLTDRLPVLVGVQAEGCKPLADAFTAGLKAPERVMSSTRAESIGVGYPRNGLMALRDVRNSRGRFVSVSDEDMIEAMRLISSSTGIFPEIASASTIAAIQEDISSGRIDGGSSVIALMTGSGIKNSQSMEVFTCP